MRTVMEAILHRRAIRRFDARQVEEGALAQILEAGLYAPSAGGGQRPLFVVCQNRELNLLLGKNKRAHSRTRMAKRHKKRAVQRCLGGSRSAGCKGSQAVHKVGVGPGEQAPAVPHLNAEPALCPRKGELGLGQGLSGGDHRLVGIPPLHGDEDFLYRGGLYLQHPVLNGEALQLGALGPVEPAGPQGLNHSGVAELPGGDLHKPAEGVVEGMA